MLYIDKSRTPAIFAEVKRTVANYDELHENDKTPLKRVLIAEQGALCAYCMNRINESTSTIEHYIPRHGEHGDMSLSLEYSNLFAVCNYTRNAPKKDKTCDDARGDTLLTVDPRRKADIEKLRYKLDGTILSDDAAIDHDLNETLNLNITVLRNNRKAAMDSAMKKLCKQKPGHWDKKFLEKQLQKYSTQNPKTPYLGAILFLLYKKLKSC